MKTIAIANQKGGTAKTTTTAALGVQLSRRGIPTHMVDMDPQADLTAAFGIRDGENRLFAAIHAQEALPVVPVADNLTVSPSNLELLRAETEFLTRPSREFVLRSALGKTPLPEHTVVLVDCPPSLGVLSIASLVAADGLCLVVQPGGFELQTLVHLGQTVELLRQYVNPVLETIGAIVTNCHRRRSITNQVAQELATQYEVLGVVRADAKLVYATTAGCIHRLHRSAAMEDYQATAVRLIQWVNS
jgi:chromosome partitioning protein